MKKPCVPIILVTLFLAASSFARAEAADLRAQVAESERAFAKTMADRDHVAFASFLSEEAIFLSGGTELRGKRAIADQWKAYFADPEAPFSWEPETVSVLESGKLALSTGPVLDAQGKRVSTFTSIWRLDEDGVWRIIFDRGTRYCE